MANNANLFNATVIGENPNSNFVIEGNHLHAVEQRIADRKKQDQQQVTSMMEEALKALIQFSKGKVEDHFLNMDFEELSNHPNQKELLVEKIHQIFSHLPHHDRNELSSMIHHKPGSRG